jgi:hypothetical protein
LKRNPVTVPPINDMSCSDIAYLSSFDVKVEFQSTL